MRCVVAVILMGTLGKQPKQSRTKRRKESAKLNPERDPLGESKSVTRKKLFRELQVMIN